jgi:hypothetical protein
MILILAFAWPIALWCPFRARPGYACLPRARLRQEGGYLYPLPPHWRGAAKRQIDAPRVELALDGPAGAVDAVCAVQGHSLRLEPYPRSALLRIEGGVPTLEPPHSVLPYWALEIEIIEDFDEGD